MYLRAIAQPVQGFEQARQCRLNMPWLHEELPRVQAQVVHAAVELADVVQQLRDLLQLSIAASCQVRPSGPFERRMDRTLFLLRLDTDDPLQHIDEVLHHVAALAASASRRQAVSSLAAALTYTA
eukprot:3270556-Heterocapsa_arctica.AAC.1